MFHSKNLGLGVESRIVWFVTWQMRKGNKVDLLYFMITACKLNLTGLLLKIKELEQFQSMLFKNKHVAI